MRPLPFINFHSGDRYAIHSRYSSSGELDRCNSCTRCFKNYVLQAEGYTGNISITDAAQGNDEYLVDVLGVYNESLKTDGMDGILCKSSKNRIVCPSVETQNSDVDDFEFAFEILVEGTKATVSNFRGSITINADGVYIKQ